MSLFKLKDEAPQKNLKPKGLKQEAINNKGQTAKGYGLIID